MQRVVIIMAIDVDSATAPEELTAVANKSLATAAGTTLIKEGESMTIVGMKILTHDAAFALTEELGIAPGEDVLDRLAEYTEDKFPYEHMIEVG